MPVNFFHDIIQTMTDETKRLYKLMIMYMLNRVDFPLSNNQISNFMLERQYTDYFTLQEIIHSLEEDDFVKSALYHNSTRYSLTDRGLETISIFSGKVPSSIREDIDNYLKDNKYELKCESETVSEYFKTDNGDYTARLRVNEGSHTLIDLALSVPSEEEARAICSKWKQNNQAVYEFIMKTLM